ncbi:type VII secretion-associated serine protease mycosin [Streptomyces monticola]|uniref:Type VII secretion-associated serine protease mycosin n=1 Tax=Streptomyces monticola TaxID=2666263 RepID=A0ABW2JB33_9ACTN
MRSSIGLPRRLGRGAAAALGLLLAGLAATPAHVGEVRDKQWHLDAMRADEMWKTSTGKGVTVAVIDSGVEESPMELRGQVLDGKDFAPHKPGDEHTDYDGHGTGIAALIAGTGAGPGGDGAFGLAPDSKILPLRVPYDSLGSKFDKPLVEAIRYAADSNAQIINISVGGARDIPGADAAVKYALSKGKLIFASSGNEGEHGSPVNWPAATPGVVGVAALGRNIETTKESTHGPHVDLSAPGDELVHACAGGTGLCKSHGTSGAAAIASASPALIWSKHPTWTNNQVLRVLVETAGKAKSGKERSDYVGYGAVRPRIALKNPGDPGPAEHIPAAGLPKGQAEVAALFRCR